VIIRNKREGEKKDRAPLIKDGGLQLKTPSASCYAIRPIQIEGKEESFRDKAAT